MKNADLPAMPIEINGFGQYAPEAFSGMTKREMIAIHAMQGITSNEFSECTGSSWAEDIASSSVKLADALLKELEK